VAIGQNPAKIGILGIDLIRIIADIRSALLTSNVLERVIVVTPAIGLP
jgi:hypothetical protein